MGGLADHLLRLGDWLREGDEKPIWLGTIDWEKIEHAYGQALSPDVRTACERATTSFVLWEESERTGATAASVRTIIEACQKRASEFQKLLSSPETSGGGYARWLITKNFS